MPICNIASRLRDMAQRAPFKRAVVFPAGRDALGRVTYSHLTFAQLDRDSDAYARGFQRVGIGRTPAANKLEVEGNASKAAAGSWLANSDARIKTEVEPIRGALKKLEAVNPVEFRYTDAYRARHPVIADRTYANVIAQEFAEVFPGYVQSSGETLENGEAILQVDSYPLTIYTAAAVRELYAEIQAKDVVIKDLQQRLSEVEARLEIAPGDAR